MPTSWPSWPPRAPGSPARPTETEQRTPTMPMYEGRLDATGLRIALVAARFNETITKSLLDGALSALRRHGLDDASNPGGVGVPPGITVAWVPGAYELPLAAKRL